MPSLDPPLCICSLGEHLILGHWATTDADDPRMRQPVGGEWADGRLPPTTSPWSAPKNVFLLLLLLIGLCSAQTLFTPICQAHHPYRWHVWRRRFTTVGTYRCASMRLPRLHSGHWSNRSQAYMMGCQWSRGPVMLLPDTFCLGLLEKK